MNRLLFAAARGARIEVLDEDAQWVPKTQWGFSPLGDYRIHPDDEHLQYGPISSALRAEAEQPLGVATTFGIQGCLGSYWVPLTDALLTQCCDAIHRSLFLLFLAEVLADEGL